MVAEGYGGFCLGYTVDLNGGNKGVVSGVIAYRNGYVVNAFVVGHTRNAVVNLGNGIIIGFVNVVLGEPKVTTDKRLTVYVRGCLCHGLTVGKVLKHKVESACARLVNFAPCVGKGFVYGNFKANRAGVGNNLGVFGVAEFAGAYLLNQVVITCNRIAVIGGTVAPALFAIGA